MNTTFNKTNYLKDASKEELQVCLEHIADAMGYIPNDRFMVEYVAAQMCIIVSYMMDMGDYPYDGYTTEEIAKAISLVSQSEYVPVTCFNCDRKLFCPDIFTSGCN